MIVKALTDRNQKFQERKWNC